MSSESSMSGQVSFEYGSRMLEMNGLSSPFSFSLSAVHLLDCALEIYNDVYTTFYV